MVSVVCANTVPAADTSASSIKTRATRLTADAGPEMEVCLIFTGYEPCGEHKVSFEPLFGFTGRICTPSFAENPSFLGVSDRSLRKDRFYRTAPILPKLSGASGDRNPSHSLPEAGGMLLRRATRALDIVRQLTVFNSRIFSALKASYECGRQFEPQVSGPRSHRRGRCGRSASIV